MGWREIGVNGEREASTGVGFAGEGVDCCVGGSGRRVVVMEMRARERERDVWGSN